MEIGSKAPEVINKAKSTIIVETFSILDSTIFLKLK